MAKIIGIPLVVIIVSSPSLRLAEKSGESSSTRDIFVLLAISKIQLKTLPGFTDHCY